MSTAKAEVAALLERLPDDCTIEDIQYHLYVLDRIRRGMHTAATQGTIPQDEAERHLR